MNQVYSRPRYYDDSWRGMRVGLNTAKKTDPEGGSVNSISVAELRDKIPHEWDYSIYSFLQHWMGQMNISLEEMFALYCNEFTSLGDRTGEFYFGGPDEEEPDKFTPEFRLFAKSFDPWEQIPFEKGIDGFITGETTFIADPSSVNTFAVKVEDAQRVGKVHYNLLNSFYCQKLMELLAIDVGRLLERGKHRPTKGEVKGLSDLAEVLEGLRGVNDSNKDEIARLAATAIFPQNFAKLKTLFGQILQMRGVMLLNLAALTDDPQDAFDWLTSIDSPIFCGPDAAELSTIAADVYEDSYPNFFRLRSESED